MKEIESILVKYLDMAQESEKVNPAITFILIVFIIPMSIIAIPVDLIRFLVSKLRVG